MNSKSDNLNLGTLIHNNHSISKPAKPKIIFRVQQVNKKAQSIPSFLVRRDDFITDQQDNF